MHEWPGLKSNKITRSPLLPTTFFLSLSKRVDRWDRRIRTKCLNCTFCLFYFLCFVPSEEVYEKKHNSLLFCVQHSCCVNKAKKRYSFHSFSTCDDPLINTNAIVELNMEASPHAFLCCKPGGSREFTPLSFSNGQSTFLNWEYAQWIFVSPRALVYTKKGTPFSTYSFTLYP